MIIRWGTRYGPCSDRRELARRGCSRSYDIDAGVHVENCEAARLALMEYAKARSIEETFRPLCVKK
jgi:hypothetical protein